VEQTLATLGSLILGVALAVAGPGPTETTQATVPTSSSQSRGAPLQRILVAVPDAGTLTEPFSVAVLTTHLQVADPAATPVVMLREDPARTIGSFHISIEPPAAPGDSVASVRIRVDGGVDVVAPLRPATGDPATPTQVTVIEVLGGVTGIVAHRTGSLELTPDELRLPSWRLPGNGVDAVALDGAWWSLGPTRAAAEPLASPPPDHLRARLVQDRVSAMRRVVDVSVGDVTGDGTPEVAISFRRPYRKTLLNASMPRRFWTDDDGLSAHVGLYRMTDLSEIWVAGTLVRPVRRLAACTGALAVAYSTLRRPRVVATSAWRWQGFAFLPLPELPGRGTPTCIDIDSDGRSEAAMIERS
jgi:hypothetical protein